MLKGEGRWLGLCSNKQHAFTVEIVEELGIAKYFSAVSGEREGHPRKPDPAPLLTCFTRFESRRRMPLW